MGVFGFLRLGFRVSGFGSSPGALGKAVPKLRREHGIRKVVPGDLRV